MVTYSVILHYYCIIIFHYHFLQLLLILLLLIWVNVSHASKNISKKHSFLNTHALFSLLIFLLGGLFFAWKKTPAGAGRPSKRGWSYPITFRSLVVKHPAPTQNFDRNVDIFLTYFGVVWDHLGCIQGVVRGC